MRVKMFQPVNNRIVLILCVIIPSVQFSDKIPPAHSPDLSFTDFGGCYIIILFYQIKYSVIYSVILMFYSVKIMDVHFTVSQQII